MSETTTLEAPEAVETPVSDPVPSPEPAPESPQPEASTEESTPEDLTSYYTERGLSSQPEPEAPETPDTDSQEARIAKLPASEQGWVKDLLETKRQTETRQKIAQTEGRRRAFEGTAQGLRSWGLSQGVDPQEVERLVNTFSNFNGLSLEFAHQDKATELRDAVFEVGAKLLPAAERDSFLAKKESDEPTKAFVQGIVEASRKGYVKESQVKAEAAKQVADYRRWLTDSSHPERLQAVQSQTSAPSGNGSSNSSNTGKSYSTMTPEERMAMTPEQRDAAVARDAARRR